MTGNRCNVKKKSLKKIKYWQRNDGFKAAHSREFVYDFCFVSSKTSQNVAFRIYLHEVNSKFMSTAIIDSKLYASFFLDENLHGCKNQ